MPWARNFCPFRAYWVISTVQVDPFPSREGNLKRKGRETSRENSSGRPQGKPHERNPQGRPQGKNPQGDLKGNLTREILRETSGRPQGRIIPVGAAPKNGEKETNKQIKELI